MTRAEEIDELLEELYAQVPVIDCKGLCTESCGPIDGGIREKVRMRRAGVRLPPRDEALRQLYLSGGRYTCPALKDGRCSVYEVRPMVCRLWGASQDLVCQFGCRPTDGSALLSSAESLALLVAAGTFTEAKPAEWFAQELADPEKARHYRRIVQQSVDARPIFGE